MGNINQVTEGSLAKNNKMNEVISKLNPLLNIEVSSVEATEPLEIEYSDNNVVLRVPKSLSGGGGIPDGYETIVLDYVSASNAAASGTFLIETVVIP